MKVLFNEERALRVFSALAAKWQTQRGIYRESLLPQNLYALPSKPVDMANYLMYGAIPMRGAVNSDDPFQLLRCLYERYPDMFNPKRVVRSWTAGKIEQAFLQTVRELKSRKVLVGLAENEAQVGAASLSYNFDDHVRCWMYNSHTLARDWDGNLLNIYQGVSNFEEAFARIDYKKILVPGNGWIPRLNPIQGGFIGMRRKIFALLTIWLQEKGLVPQFPTPIPVDFHALRIMWSTGIISFEGLEPFVPRTEKQAELGLDGRLAVYISENVIDQITLWSQEFFVKHKINHMYVNPALWVHSRQMCAFHPQSRMQRPPKRGQPKLKRTSANARRDGGFVDKHLLRDISAWPREYRNECALCPLNSECTGIMPAGIYYRTSFLVFLERAEYPQQHVLGDLGDVPLWGRKVVPSEREVVPIGRRKEAAGTQRCGPSQEGSQNRFEYS